MQSGSCEDIWRRASKQRGWLVCLQKSKETHVPGDGCARRGGEGIEVERRAVARAWGLVNLGGTDFILHLMGSY